VFVIGSHFNEATFANLDELPGKHHSEFSCVCPLGAINCGIATQSIHRPAVVSAPQCVEHGGFQNSRGLLVSFALRACLEQFESEREPFDLRMS